MITEEIKSKCDALSNKIIGCAIEVHKHLGPGLLESAYESCLCFELDKAGISYKRQLDLPVVYKDINLETGYRIDILAEELVIVELKSVSEVSRIDKAQLKTYLKLSHKWLGLLMNFNVEYLKDGIERVVWG